MKKNIEDLFNENILTVAKKPQNNDLPEFSEGKKLLLIPIDHDYPGGSSIMHNAVFEKYNLPYRTSFVVANPENTQIIVESFRNDPMYVGGGVGSGFKDKVGKYLDDLHESAKITGSVNVISKKDGKLIGYNTDGVGYVRDLTLTFPDSVENKSIVILGAGGTALPIAYELAKLSPKKISVVNRTISKAENIVDLISKYTNSKAFSEDEISKTFFDADLVINTTNKGTTPFEEYTAFAPINDKHYEIANENLDNLNSNSIISDILLEDSTPTLDLGKKRGFRIHNGKGMNMFQAVPAMRYMIDNLDVSDDDLEKIFRGVIN